MRLKSLVCIRDEANARRVLVWVSQKPLDSTRSNSLIQRGGILEVDDSKTTHLGAGFRSEPEARINPVPGPE